MGKWEFRQVEQHKCDKPTYNTDRAHVGDIWKCDCGIRWRVTKVNFDQRDGDWLSWEKLAPEISTESWRNPSWRD